MSGPPAADRNTVQHPQTLPSEQVRPSRSPEKKRAPPGQTSLRPAHKQPPTLHVTKTPTAAVPNRRSVTWEGRTGWEDRYIDTNRDRPRIGPGGNGWEWCPGCIFVDIIRIATYNFHLCPIGCSCRNFQFKLIWGFWLVKSFVIMCVYHVPCDFSYLFVPWVGHV